MRMFAGRLEGHQVHHVHHPQADLAGVDSVENEFSGELAIGTERRGRERGNAEFADDAAVRLEQRRHGLAALWRTRDAVG